MKQFIRYLYEYQQGQRIRNVGFVKVEQTEEKTTVHIHGKGLRLDGDKTLKLYIFYTDKNICWGIWQGDIENANPAVNYRLIFTDQDTGQPENYSVINGIILEQEGRRKFVAAWDDAPVDVDGMQVWNPKGEETEEEEKAPEDYQMEEEPDAEIVPEEEPEAEEEDGYITPAKPQYRKIVRQDIAELPRCEWRLANNSFLLHGFHNYHHLIFMEDGEGFWLGVPGIFHEREARAAKSFGFPRFVRVEDDGLELDENEKSMNDDFGYWCRRVRGSGIF